MKKLFFSLIGSLLVTGLLWAQNEEPGFQAYWHNGFILKSTDGNFDLKFGGRVQTDFAFFQYDSELDELFDGLKNGAEFRRARFFNQGTVYGKVNYKIQVDFTSGSAVFKDVYIGLKGLPGVGNLRVGHFKEPMRLEVLTSSKYITFMERAPGVSFTPERNLGLMVFNHSANKKWTWALGFFRRSDKQGNDKVANEEFNVTGRVSGLLLHHPDQKQLLHVGAAASYRKPDDQTYAISVRPNSHLAPKFLNTHTIEGTDHLILLAAEAAFVHGPFSLQGEFINSTVNARNEETGSLEDSNLSSFYVYASYFLTGESRKYSTSSGVFSRVSPKKNFGQEGSGAWEVALRYAKTDLNDKFIRGGELSEITVGLNWYLNPVARIMFNYSLADLAEVGKASILGTRFQIDF